MDQKRKRPGLGGTPWLRPSCTTASTSRRYPVGRGRVFPLLCRAGGSTSFSPPDLAAAQQMTRDVSKHRLLDGSALSAAVSRSRSCLQQIGC